MDKLQMAHDWAMQSIDTGYVCETETLVSEAWKYADAMQAEAEKRINKERPEVLCEVDWNQATDNTIAWFMLLGSGNWLLNDFRIVCAPTFGFTGSHIVERPQ